MVSNPGFPHLYTIVLENRKVFFKFTQVPLLILTLWVLTDLYWFEKRQYE